jgi:hypothetical protein
MAVDIGGGHRLGGQISDCGDDPEDGGFARLVVSTAVVESEALAVLRHSDPTVVHRHVLLHV